MVIKIVVHVTDPILWLFFAAAVIKETKAQYECSFAKIWKQIPVFSKTMVKGYNNGRNRVVEHSKFSHVTNTSHPVLGLPFSCQS